MNKCVVIYVCYFFDFQLDVFIEDQVCFVKEYVDLNDLEFVVMYKDQVIFGVLFFRLGIQKLLEDV